MNLKPLEDKLVIKKVEKEETTKSGIVLPSSAKEESNIAEIIAIGKGILDDEKRKDEVQVGDKIVFSKYSGSELEIEDEKFTIIKYSDILAVIK
ncbi:co-chaperone GroES [Anaerosphaera multitolerans]|uniref:Co-chaperonin GroES n=1 Tax=Anaerosphaera multitolerans TaxID=2487351 RepID=A0A437S9S9_9FIRM|nr:co-chaperone GroES [Anaerosphaera multitolerans]RVU55567.1 co-chaperone GroES [Anaerosphaera multitolerans]